MLLQRRNAARCPEIPMAKPWQCSLVTCGCRCTERGTGGSQGLPCAPCRMPSEPRTKGTGAAGSGCIPAGSKLAAWRASGRGGEGRNVPSGTLRYLQVSSNKGSASIRPNFRRLDTTPLLAIVQICTVKDWKGSEASK